MSIFYRQMSVIKSLEKLISIHGISFVAYHLGYRDTQAIQKWIERGDIPKKRVEAVKSFIRKTDASKD